MPVIPNTQATLTHQDLATPLKVGTAGLGVDAEDINLIRVWMGFQEHRVAFTAYGTTTQRPLMDADNDPITGFWEPYVTVEFELTSHGTLLATSWDGASFQLVAVYADSTTQELAPLSSFSPTDRSQFVQLGTDGLVGTSRLDEISIPRLIRGSSILYDDGTPSGGHSVPSGRPRTFSADVGSDFLVDNVPESSIGTFGGDIGTLATYFQLDHAKTFSHLDVFYQPAEE